MLVLKLRLLLLHLCKGHLLGRWHSLGALGPHSVTRVLGCLQLHLVLNLLGLETAIAANLVRVFARIFLELAHGEGTPVAVV